MTARQNRSLQTVFINLISSSQVRTFNHVLKLYTFKISETGMFPDFKMYYFLNLLNRVFLFHKYLYKKTDFLFFVTCFCIFTEIIENGHYYFF